MTSPSDIAGLSERLRDRAVQFDSGYARDLTNEAATAIDSLTARVKELEAEVEKWHRVAMKAGVIVCENGGLIYSATDRALRAEQQRDEAVTVINLGLDVISQERGWGTYPRMEGSQIYADADAFRNAARDLVRRLASGPEGGEKPQESKP